MQLQSKVRRRRVVTFPRLIFHAIFNLKKWHVEAKTTTCTACHSFLTHETIRGSLKLELEAGKYNKEFRGLAGDTFSTFKIRSASIGPNLKNKRGVGDF